MSASLTDRPAPPVEVRSLWDGSIVGRVPVPDAAEVERVVAAAHACRAELAALPAHRREPR